MAEEKKPIGADPLPSGVVEEKKLVKFQFSADCNFLAVDMDHAYQEISDHFRWLATQHRRGKELSYGGRMSINTTYKEGERRYGQ